MTVLVESIEKGLIESQVLFWDGYFSLSETEVSVHLAGQFLGSHRRHVENCTRRVLDIGQ